MSAKELSAGDYIASKCTKCKETTNHTIVAMVAEAVVKVQCNTCNSTHKYRAETKKKTPLRRKAGATKPRVPTKAERSWDEFISEVRPEDAVPYNLTTPMVAKMLIQHPSFGLGQVVTTIRPNKMEVQFQSGIKLLRCKTN